MPCASGVDISHSFVGQTGALAFCANEESRDPATKRAQKLKAPKTDRFRRCIATLFRATTLGLSPKFANVEPRTQLAQWLATASMHLLVPLENEPEKPVSHLQTTSTG